MPSIPYPNAKAKKLLVYEIIEEALEAATDYGAATITKDADMVYAELNLTLATEKLYNAINNLMESRNE